MDESEEPPSLAELAEGAGLSPSHFHRLFKNMVGVTPKQYAMQTRANRVRANLPESSTVTEALYEAGFSSSSRFYEDTPRTLGMKPSEYQNGGHGVRISYALAPCYLGWVLVAATAKGICAIEFGDAPEPLEKRLRDRFPQATAIDDDPDLAAWVAQILTFLDAPQTGLDLPLDIQGTAFQRRVWMALREIPTGSTISYGELAARIGQPQATRAVAQACASNRIALAIPCHRVVRKDGTMAGYRWGQERKRQLLDREAQ
jgi:AraC family transcriptional regulator of adaptative response/methylated-DNA-[protein]-cysteine methyltransferase